MSPVVPMPPEGEHVVRSTSPEVLPTSAGLATSEREQASELSAICFPRIPATSAVPTAVEKEHLAHVISLVVPAISTSYSIMTTLADDKEQRRVHVLSQFRAEARSGSRPSSLPPKRTRQRFCLVLLITD